jgi:hypothetical protein
VEDVVGRLGGVSSQNQPAAELSINTRRAASLPGDIEEALADGRLIRTFAFRGGTYLMTPANAAAYLALRASGKQWELPAWQEFYKLKPADWPGFRETVRDALANGPLARQELGAAVTRHSRYSHLGFVFTEDNWTLIKPLTWLGDMSFAPSPDGRATFQRLDSNPHWPGLLDLDEAGPKAIEHYFSAYGPATAEHIQYWLGNGLSAARKSLRVWMDELRGRLTEIDVDGEAAFVLAEHADELLASKASTVVRLLPAIDQWVFGPGTTDPHVTPPARRALVTRGSNFVIAGGVVSGTWTLKKDVVAVDWFAESGTMPHQSLSDEVRRLGSILHRPITFSA